MLRRALAHATVRKRAEAQLAHQALHDQLTGLPNRALFLDRLGVALERARRSGAQLAVLFLDFDNFKQINDSRGHAAGDRLLAIVGERLSGLLAPDGHGGALRRGRVHLPVRGPHLRARGRADRRPHLPGRAPTDRDRRRASTSVTVSVGIAMVADPTVSSETVLREADAAMYRAKAQGRSRYELFDEDSRRRAVERIELEAAVRQAIERRELRVHYQPTLDLDDSREPTGRRGAGALAASRAAGLIAAREFMPVAEDVGLVIPIGRFVLEHALERLAHWRARRPDMTLSLNISPCQLHDPALPAALQAALDARELEPSAICLEIPERAVAEDPETAIDALERLKAIGVRIALDDFGSGTSSLSRLRELPVDELKLHESFIAPVGSAPEDASIVGALIELGHSLGLTVVAEGVEHESQIEQLRELGCDAAQGYAIGRPVPEEQLEAAIVGGLTPAA